MALLSVLKSPQGPTSSLVCLNLSGDSITEPGYIIPSTDKWYHRTAQATRTTIRLQITNYSSAGYQTDHA